MSWERKPLADVADFCLGKMLDQKKNRGELLPYLANVNVRWGDFDLDNLREMRIEDHELDRYSLKYGDIVMCEGGEPGRCAIWKDQMPRMIFQKALHRIRPHDCLLPDFLYYVFLYKGRAGHLGQLFTGSTIKHLPREKLAQVEVDVPPIPVQEDIVNILSTYDDLVENNSRRIQLLEESARLLYREWFVHLRFPGHEHVNVVDGVPEEWEVRPLAEVADITMGQSPKSEFYNQVGDGLPFHQGASDFGERFVNHRVYTTVKNRVANPGDILCTVRAPVGRLNMTLDQIVVGRGLSAIREKYGRQSHLYYQLKQHFFREDLFGTGAIFAGIKKKELAQQKLVRPPDRLINEFEEYAQPIDQQIATLTKQNQKLAEARDILLPRLMNGEIAV